MKCKNFLCVLLFILGGLEAQGSESIKPDTPNAGQSHLLECVGALLSSQSHKSLEDKFTKEVHGMVWTSLRIATILNHYANPFFVPKRVKVNLYHFFLAGITEVTTRINRVSFINSTLFNVLKELDILEDFQFFLLKQLGFDRNNLGPFLIEPGGCLILDIISGNLARKLVRLKDDNMVLDEDIIDMIYHSGQIIASQTLLFRDLISEDLNSLGPVDLNHLVLAVLKFENPIHGFLLDHINDLEDEIYPKLILQTTNTNYHFNAVSFQSSLMSLISLIRAANGVDIISPGNLSFLEALEQKISEGPFQEIYLTFNRSGK